MKENDIPAFPILDRGSNLTNSFYNEGMSLRDYFAAKIVAITYGDSSCDNWHTQTHAENAYKMADTMLKERNK